MLEKEMEDLIANYPDDFFPGKHLELVEKQKRILDVGVFNVFFRNESGEEVLIKIIPRPARIGDSAQWSHYKENLKKFGYENMDVWLIALHISPDIKSSFDQIGIVSFEIGESKLQQVLERHRHEFRSNEGQSTAAEQFNKSNCGEKIPPSFAPGFKRKLETLQEEDFLAAYFFLDYPRLNKHRTDISLTTSVNAHLHFGRYFLAYITIGDNFIHFIPLPKPGSRLPAGAIDRHQLLFSKLPLLIKRFNGMEQGWAERGTFKVESQGIKVGTYIFRIGTPKEFFEALIETIEHLTCE